MKKILNQIRILFLSAIILAAFAVPTNAGAVLLYTGSANQVVYLGESFMVEWYVDTQGHDINSLDLTLTYTKDKLEVVDTSIGNSDLDLWVKAPKDDKENGQINLVGGISAGVSNKKLNIFRASFRPIDLGAAKLSLATSSDALIADGLGSSAGVTFREVNFTINPLETRPAKITSPSHPDQDTWYRNQNAQFLVEPKAGEQYSYSFSSNIDIIPDQNADEVSRAIVFNNLPDGIYYFKLSSKPEGPTQWIEAGVYRVQIDTTPPKEFTPAVAKDDAIFDGQPFVSFNTIDNTSGVEYYEVKTALGGWKKTEDPYYKLPGLVLGDTIEVKVVDAAGNERIETVTIDRNIVKAAYLNPMLWGIIIAVLVVGGILTKIYLRLLRKYKINDN